MEQNNFENKTIRCDWCSNYNGKNGLCFINQLRVAPKKKRRCKNFSPNYTKIDKHINKGKDIKTIKRPDGYFLKGSERKKYIKELVAKQVKEETQRNEAHPLTGALGNITSTAV